MKKVIVTGANGFVGRYLVQELTEKKYEVYAVVRSEDEDIECILKYNPYIVFCDLKDISSLTEKIKIGSYSCFFHLAWAGSSGMSRNDYRLQLENARFCADAAKVASELGCRRFVGAGSVTELMYGEYLKQDNSKPEMVTCYAIGKIAAEYTCRCVCNENKIDFLWGYISNFYGIGDTSQNIINYIVKCYLNSLEPELTAGNQDADFMYVSDVAKALVAMAEKGKEGATYYVGYGKPRPLREFILDMHTIINPVIDTGLDKREFRGLSIDFKNIDINKLKSHTGFEPHIEFSEGIKKTIDWLKEEEKV